MQMFLNCFKHKRKVKKDACAGHPLLELTHIKAFLHFFKCEVSFFRLLAMVFSLLDKEPLKKRLE